MVSSKDNPHKPGTEEWKDFEKCVATRDGMLGKQDERYIKAKATADARLYSAKEQFKKQNERFVEVDELLKFLEGDEPEYDPVLDSQENNVVPYSKSLGALADDILSSIKNQVSNGNMHWLSTAPLSPDDTYRNLLTKLLYPNPERPTICFPCSIPDGVNVHEVIDIMVGISKKLYDPADYSRGYIDIPIQQRLNVMQYKPNDPNDPLGWSNLTYNIARFYIRRNFR